MAGQQSQLCLDLNGRLLGLVLAGVVATVGGGPKGNQLGYIRGWVLKDIDLQSISLTDRWRFERSLRRLVHIIRTTEWDIRWLCQCLAGPVPPVIRCQVMELCVVVAAQLPRIKAEVVGVLKSICKALDLDMVVLSRLVQMYVPIDALQVKDVEVLLGISQVMAPHQVRQQLNRQYAQWNARARSADRTISSQADQMLELIADARLVYLR